MATLVELVCLVERATLETLDYLDALETGNIKFKEFNISEYLDIISSL